MTLSYNSANLSVSRHLGLDRRPLVILIWKDSVTSIALKYRSMFRSSVSVCPVMIATLIVSRPSGFLRRNLQISNVLPLAVSKATCLTRRLTSRSTSFLFRTTARHLVSLTSCFVSLDASSRCTDSICFLLGLPLILATNFARVIHLLRKDSLTLTFFSSSPAFWRRYCT